VGAINKSAEQDYVKLYSVVKYVKGDNRMCFKQELSIKRYLYFSCIRIILIQWAQNLLIAK